MSVDQAIQAAIDEVKRRFPGEDYQLEELESRDNGDFVITVSYHAPDRPSLVPLHPPGTGSSRRAALGIDPARTYKDVVVASDGQIKAIKIRQIVLG